MVDVLGPEGDEGRGSLRKSQGSRQTGFDPEVPELISTESIGRESRTQGTETSQYLEEEKSTETASVAASERA